MEEAAQEKKGIGGWLILPVIGLIVLPLRLAYSLMTDFLPIFQQGYWELLTVPGTDAYHPLWGPLLTFEIVGNVFFIVFALVLLYLVFTKHPRTPGLFIAFLATNLAFVTGDFFAANLIPAVAAQDDAESVKELARTAIGAMIWIPYFLKSERVRNTFAKPDPAMDRSPALAAQA